MYYLTSALVETRFFIFDCMRSRKLLQKQRIFTKPVKNFKSCPRPPPPTPNPTSLGQLAFPSKLLRRFLRGCVVATAHGLVTAPAGLYDDEGRRMFWTNCIFARVMSGVVRARGDAARGCCHRPHRRQKWRYCRGYKL